MQMIEDPSVMNKVCCSITQMQAFNMKTFPYLIARSRHHINLINVKTGALQPLIKDTSCTAWYQHSLLVISDAAPNSGKEKESPMRILYSQKECHSAPQDAQLNGEHHLVRELTFDAAFMTNLRLY